MTFVVNLDLNGIAQPAVTTAAVCKEIVDLYFSSLEKVDLSEKPADHSEGKFLKVGFSGHNFTAEERRNVHQNWILAKAFQDLMRGVRSSLEEAYFVFELIAAGTVRAKSSATLEQTLQPFRNSAARLNFPKLLEAVNTHLQQPLEFSEAYQSMQAARNCLEHRNGVVGQTDIDENGKMVLQFPRFKLFVERDGQEVEVYSGLQAREGGENILIKTELRSREYPVGHRLLISAGDFDEIALACSQFGFRLSQAVSAILAPLAEQQS